MCGIVGYIGYRYAQPVLLNCLKRLEYRGYDSCGVALANGSLSVVKTVGRVEDLTKVVERDASTFGIGHTRWATHGGVTTANAHPHTDCQGKIAVVHNGIIENFRDLRAKLQCQGHIFRSETDTEVIPHLVESFYSGDLAQAVKAALAQIIGSYAVVILSPDSRVLFAARRDSPLVVGVGDRESFVASDVGAMLDYTDRAIYLEEGDFCAVTDSTVTIENGVGQVSRRVSPVPWTVSQVQKGGYDHFMLKEIHDQARAVADTLVGHVPAIETETDMGVILSNGTSNVVITACGSSYHAGLVAEHLFARLCKIRAKAVIASEFELVEPILANHWVVAITQSGETADTLRALRKAIANGCRTLAVVNVLGSTATRLANDTMFIGAGPEISVAATKTFLAQLAAMYTIALSHSSLSPRDRSRLAEELKALPATIDRALEIEPQIAEVGAQLAAFDSAFILAKGINCPIAMEGALKLKEVAYIHAEAFPAGELKHGCFALLGPKVPTVALVPRDETYSLMQTCMKEVKARGSWVIGIADEHDSEVEQFADCVIRLPAVHPLLTPFPNTVALQLLAYYAAKARGCPIDRPRNLAKSVTVL